ncbi:MAG TPA: nitrile hydratase accessory protein [Kiloniellales bacterium]|jgi:nitrile hydratase accessory protein
MTGSALPPLAGQPRDDTGPVFREPWEAQAFAMTLKLHEGGWFTWPEWAAALAGEIAAAKARGEPDSGDTYYHHWLAALEKMVAAKTLIREADLRERRDAWAAAARATPHGRPIVLPPTGD